MRRGLTRHNLVYALEHLRQEGAVDMLILDLREAHGQELDDACAVADVFLSRGRIASLRWFSGEVTARDTTPPQTLAGCRMAALVGSGTAFGGELVAGALKEHGRAVLVGRPTAGAGLAYRAISVGNEFLWMPLGRFLLPSGRSFEGAPIAPDVPVDADGRAVIDAAIAALPPYP